LKQIANILNGGQRGGEKKNLSLVLAKLKKKKTTTKEPKNKQIGRTSKIIILN